jgi:hypothetical protein
MNERTIFMAGEGGGGSMDSESIVRKNNVEAKAEPAPVEIPGSKAAQKAERSGGRKMQEPVSRKESASDEAELAEVEDGMEKLVREPGLERAYDLLKKGLSGTPEEKESKVRTFDKVFDEVRKETESPNPENIIKALQEAGEDRGLNRDIDILLKLKYSDDEIKDFREKAKALAEPTDGQKDEQGMEAPTDESKRLEAPTEDDQAKIEGALGPVPKEVDQLLSQGDTAGAEKAAKDGLNIDWKKVGLRSAQALIYAAMSAVILYIYLMAKTGKMTGKR